MAKIIPLQQAAPAIAEARLQVARDDFSVKVTVAEDGFFWIRIEPDHAEPVVTDLNAGGLGDRAAFEALSVALREAGMAQPDVLVFRDMVPGGIRQEAGPAMAAARLRVGEAAAYVAARRGLAVAAITPQERRGKLDFRVTFKPA